MKHTQRENEITNLFEELLCFTQDMFQFSEFSEVLLQHFFVLIYFTQFVLEFLEGSL